MVVKRHSRYRSVDPSSAKQKRLTLLKSKEEDHCDQCEAVKHNVSYCSPCGLSLCSTCWEVSPPHRLQTRRIVPGMPHEKTKLGLYRKIESALYPTRTEEEEAELHAEDELATWFGLLRQGKGFTFGDAGRYDNLLLRYPPSTRLNLYPSLVCFIGDTSKQRLFPGLTD